MRGPCAKRRVSCAIAIHGCNVIFEGENDCANPQPTCPREPGEGYEKCRSICQQGEHAEIKALAAAQAAGWNVRGAIAYLHGHYYVCEPCGQALLDAGIAQLHIVFGARS